MKIGFIIFGVPIALGVGALCLNTYTKSGGQYLFEYSMLEQAWTIVKLAGIVSIAYSLLWLFSPFANDFDKVNIQMTLEIWKNHKKEEHDVEGNIIAYRYFKKLPDGTLTSVTAGRQGHNPVTGRPRGSYGGGYNISDRVPTLKNTSGIYAAKTKNSPILLPYVGPDVVLGQVRLSGKIIEAEYGYRAQYCEVIRLYE